MKEKRFLTEKIIILILLLSLSLASCTKRSKPTEFKFVFMTDIHLTPERNAVPGFMQAINTINGLHPDFVISGGDLIMDALKQRYSAADSLYNLYTGIAKNLSMPLYNTMGNHEIYGILRGERG